MILDTIFMYNLGVTGYLSQFKNLAQTA